MEKNNPAKQVKKSEEKQCVQRFSKEITETCYIIGSSGEIRKIMKQIEEQYTKLEDKTYNLSVMKNLLEKLVSIFKQLHFIEKDNYSPFDKDTTFEPPSEVLAWLDETFSNHKDTPQRAASSILSVQEYREVFSPELYASNDVVQHYLTNVSDISFNIFTLEEISPDKSIKNIFYELMKTHDLISTFKIPLQNMDRFLVAVEIGYKLHKNPYHNELHAADVTQTFNALIVHTDLIDYMSSLDMLTCIFAALIHDYEHTGTTNNFHVNTKSELALLYNDRTVLENYHVSRIFRKMRDDPKTDVFVNLTSSQMLDLRCKTIDLVLATDMSFHFNLVKNLSDSDVVSTNQLLRGFLHFSDISHPCKQFKIHEVWVEQLFKEFFKQGDEEKRLGLSVSPLCDRVSTKIPESQLGFIDLIITPFYNTLFDALPNPMTNPSNTYHKTSSRIREVPSEKVRNVIKNNLFTNRKLWSQKISQKEKSNQKQSQHNR